MKEFTPGKSCVLADHRAVIVTRKSTVENTRINVIVTTSLRDIPVGFVKRRWVMNLFFFNIMKIT